MKCDYNQRYLEISKFEIICHFLFHRNVLQAHSTDESCSILICFPFPSNWMIFPAAAWQAGPRGENYDKIQDETLLLKEIYTLFNVQSKLMDKFQRKIQWERLYIFKPPTSKTTLQPDPDYRLTIERMFRSNMSMLVVCFTTCLR